MNSLVSQFASSGHEVELRKARQAFEDDDESLEMWGSQAGFGPLSKGIPSFSVPSVPDVRPDINRWLQVLLTHYSLPHSSGSTQTITQTLHVELRLNTEQLPSLSGSKVV